MTPALCEICDALLSSGAARLCRKCYQDEAVRRQWRKATDAELETERQALACQYTRSRSPQQRYSIARALEFVEAERMMRKPIVRNKTP